MEQMLYTPSFTILFVNFHSEMASILYHMSVTNKMKPHLCEREKSNSCREIKKHSEFKQELDLYSFWKAPIVIMTQEAMSESEQRE